MKNQPTPKASLERSERAPSSPRIPLATPLEAPNGN